MTIERRLAKLERENRIFKCLGLILAVCAATASLVGAKTDDVHATIKAREVQLVNKSGLVKASLGFGEDEDNPMLVVGDKERMVMLTSDSKGTTGLKVTYKDAAAIVGIDVTGTARAQLKHKDQATWGAPAR